MGSGCGLPKKLLLLALVSMVMAQSATTAFSQEEVPLSSSDQQSPAPGDAAKSRVLQIPEGRFVEVELADGGIMRGKLGELREGGFILRTVSHNRLIKRLVRFEEVKSIRPLDNLKTPGQAFDKNLDRAHKIVGLVVGGVAVGLLIAAVAAAR
jgi:hypothetical protein